MDKKKIFVYDTMCLGFPDSITYLKGETFLFTAKTSPHYLMFYTGNVYLIKAGHHGHECHGEMFEVSQSTFDRINKKFSKMKYSLEEIIVFDSEGKEHQVFTWLYTRKQLEARGLKATLIKCFRDMSPALSGNPSLPKTCC